MQGGCFEQGACTHDVLGSSTRGIGRPRDPGRGPRQTLMLSMVDTDMDDLAAAAGKSTPTPRLGLRGGARAAADPAGRARAQPEGRRPPGPATAPEP